MSAASGGVRVAVVGGCQASGLAAWIGRLLPGSEVRGWHVHSSPEATPEAVLAQLDGYDLIVTQFAPDMDGGMLAAPRLAGRAARVVFVPLVVFGGFHPDIAFIGLRDQPLAFLRGPMDVQQSAIVLAAYHLAVPAARVPRLFNALVFEAFGYLGAFAAASSAFLRIYGAHVPGLDAALAEWLREGCFMYSDNHPHIRVLGTFARAALAEAGFAAEAAGAADPPADTLADSLQWPVYPALARGIGVAGSNSFVRPVNLVPAGEERALALPAFVEASYNLFDAAGRERLNPIPRVLRDTETLRGLLAT